jgi:predicted amidophosphoribosyltransferase
MLPRYRRYAKRTNETILVSWIQRRCEKCGRFLSKLQSKYCSLCGKKAYIEKGIRKYKQNHRQVRIFGTRIWIKLVS